MTSVLKIVGSLIKFHKQSPTGGSDNEEQCFQESIITALSRFVRRPPDYQKADIIVYIASQIEGVVEPNNDSKQGDNDNSNKNNKIKNPLLLDCLLDVSNAYQPEMHSNLISLFDSIHLRVDCSGSRFITPASSSSPSPPRCSHRPPMVLVHSISIGAPTGCLLDLKDFCQLLEGKGIRIHRTNSY